MKRTWMWCLVGLVSLASAMSQDKPAGGTEKAVAALDQRWLQSQKTNNPDLVAPLLADKFVNTGSDGKVESEAESLARAKATKYDSAGRFEANGIWRHGAASPSTGMEASGKPLNARERWTDTWVKMPNGKWQRVASYVSSVKM